MSINKYDTIESLYELKEFTILKTGTGGYIVSYHPTLTRCNSFFLTGEEFLTLSKLISELEIHEK